MNRVVHDRTPRISDIGIVALFVALLVAPMLDAAFGGLFSYIDELTTIILVLWALLASCKLDSHSRKMVVLMALICILGLIGNVYYDYQQSPFAILVDLFTCLKIFIALLSAKIVLRDKNRCIKSVISIGKLFIVAGLIGLFFHVVGIVSLGSGRIMFGVPCYQFLFSHPTNLAAYCVGFIALFFYSSRIKTGWLLALVILLISTQRAKAFAMAFVVLFFIVYSYAKKDDGKPSPAVFLFLVAGALVLGLDQIQEYFLNGTAARSLLTSDGFDIAINSFPMGSGFATFATYMSGEYYSPLYYLYGLNTVWGLYPLNPVFVSDSFWPAVIAQLGFIGLICIIWIMKESFQMISLSAKKNGIRFAAYGTIPIYLLILSTSDASFFNFYGPFFAVVIGLIISTKDEGVRNGTIVEQRNLKGY